MYLVIGPVYLIFGPVYFVFCIWCFVFRMMYLSDWLILKGWWGGGGKRGGQRKVGKLLMSPNKEAEAPSH